MVRCVHRSPHGHSLIGRWFHTILPRVGVGVFGSIAAGSNRTPTLAVVVGKLSSSGRALDKGDTQILYPEWFLLAISLDDHSNSSLVVDKSYQYASIVTRIRYPNRPEPCRCHKVYVYQNSQLSRIYLLMLPCIYHNPEPEYIPI
jgi:hypothetical protein